MKIHELDVEGALLSLNSAPEGLSPSEAARRLAEYGPNRVERARREGHLTLFLRQMTHFLALILWLAALLAFWSDVHQPGQGMGTLGVAIVGVIVVNGAFSFWQERRAQKTLDALSKLLPHRVTARRGGALAELLLDELVPGDLVLLAEGDLVPADCRLLEVSGLRLDTATFTGESHPLVCEAGPSAAKETRESRNVALAGTTAVAGRGTALVYATAMHTELGRIARIALEEEVRPSPLQKELIRLSRLVGALATAIGLVFFATGSLVGLPFWQSFLFAIGILVANVPEGLLPTVTLSLAMASQRMAKRQALIRSLPSVETLGSTTVIVTDKTGTLTEGHMAVHSVFTLGEGLRELSARPSAAELPRRLSDVARHCHNVRELSRDGRVVYSGDPTEVALVRLAATSSEKAAWPRVDEIPFDSERRRLSTVHASRDGPVLLSKGAVESLLPLCESTVEGVEGAGAVPLTPELRTRVLKAQDAMANAGMRVLAFAFRRLAEDIDPSRREERLVFAGLLGFRDPPRPEVPAAVARCRDAGIRVVMATGDHPRTALAVARRIGLVRGDAPLILTGENLRHLTETQLRLALDTPEVLFARVSAEQKMQVVEAFQKKGAIVAVTGDGVNDAPALKRADIGVAMGRTGTDVAREAADMVLLDDNFASIVAAIEEGRAVFRNIRKFLTYILTSNIPELLPYLAFVLFQVPLALPILLILAVDLGTDILPALALGAEPPAEGTLREPPRAPGERLLTRRLLLRAYLFLGPMEAVASLSAFFFVLRQGGWRYGDASGVLDPLYRSATAACFVAIVLTQIVNLFLCRGDRDESTFGRSSRHNPLLIGALAVEVMLALAIVYVPWAQELFGTAPIPAGAFLFMLPFAAGMLTLEEARKAVARRFARNER